MGHLLIPIVNNPIKSQAIINSKADLAFDKFSLRKKSKVIIKKVVSISVSDQMS